VKVGIALLDNEFEAEPVYTYMRTYII
jgi:hypothetical protein